MFFKLQKIDKLTVLEAVKNSFYVIIYTEDEHLFP